MSLDKALSQMKFDTRLIDYNLRTGQISPEELKKHLSQLPDMSSQAESLDLEESNGHVESEEHLN